MAEKPTVFILREATKKRKKPLWFQMMMAIGPCTTDDPKERAEYVTRGDCMRAPCWGHALTSWEIEGVPADA